MTGKEKRRDKGEGSVYQRSDGLWVAKYNPPNMTKPKVGYAKSEAEAKKKLQALKHDAIKNNHTEVKKMSVKEYMDAWLYNALINEVKPRSFDTKEYAAQQYVYPYIGDYQIANIMASNVQDMINGLIEKGLSYSTIKKAYDAVNACFKRGIIKGEILKNPCLGVALPVNKKKDVSDIRYFSEEELQKICEMSIKKYENGKMIFRLGYAIVLLAYTGLRMAELLGLRWTDINLVDRNIRIRSSAVLVKNRDESIKKKRILQVQSSTKTDSGARLVQLNKKAIEAVEELKKLNSSFEFIASNQNGKIIAPRNIDRMFRNILFRCGIPPCGVHTLRHTFASMLFRKGVDVKTVSELLGHADVTITYNTYIHLINEQKYKAIQLLEDL